MIKTIKKLIPQSIKSYYRLQITHIQIKKDFIYDYKQFRKHSGTKSILSKENKQAFLIKEYHAIEKGLALRNPKKSFGVLRISTLIDELENYISMYNYDQIAEITLATLGEYVEFEKNNKTVNPILSKIESVLKKHDNKKINKNIGGTKTVLKSDIKNDIDFDSFFKSRFSTRDFTDQSVDVSMIRDAVNTALFTPSVCNRQAWKVYLVNPDNKALKDKFLNVQNGNKGFGEHIGALLVVTGKLSSFFSYERNQVYIDGGMFAMSIVLALHAKGFGTCCLNTSYTAQKNEDFRNVMQMDDDCVPIMFIAVGHLKDQYKVAISQRKSLETIFSVH